LRGLETGFLDPVAGFLVDKFGPRKLMIPGLIVAGLGFLWLSRIDSLWAFYGSFMVLALGITFGSFIAMNAAVANWFVKKRSRALTVLYVGFGVSGSVVPLLALSVSQLGWRETATFVAIAFWVIGIPLSLLMRHKPSQYGYLPDGETPASSDDANTLGYNSSGENSETRDISPTEGFTAKEALKTRAFWLLSAAFSIQHIATSAVMVHIIPYLESIEVPTTIAATAVTGMTLCSLIGRLGFGFLGDFVNKRYLMATAFGVQAIGVFIFSLIDVDRVWLIVLFLLIYGPGYAGPIPLRPALLADYFGTRSFGTLFGWTAFISMIGGMVSPVIAGWIFDVTGSYRLAWQLFALVTVPAIPLILLAKAPRAKQQL